MRRCAWILLALALYAVPAFAQIANVGTPSAGSNIKGGTNAATGNLTISTTGASAIKIGVVYNSGSTFVVTEDQGNSVTQGTAKVGTGLTVRIDTITNPTTNASHVFHGDGAMTFGQICVFPISGTVTASLIDRTWTGGDVVGSPLTSGESLLPTQNDEYVFMVAGFAGDAGTVTSGGGGLNTPIHGVYSGGNYFGIACSWAIQTTATSVNPTMNYTNAFSATGDTDSNKKLAPAYSTPGIYFSIPAITN